MTTRVPFFIALSLIVMSVSSRVNAQEISKMAVVVPPEILLPAAVSQPDCPLKIENVRLLRYFSRDDYSSGGPGAIYRLRNAGKKTIVAYSIATWYSNNSGTIVDWEARTPDERIKRGRAKTPSDNPIIVPLTPDLRRKLDLSGPMQMIRFVMVIKLEFADGTHYDATSTFTALRKHLDAFGSIYEKPAGRN